MIRLQNVQQKLNVKLNRCVLKPLSVTRRTSLLHSKLIIAKNMVQCIDNKMNKILAFSSLILFNSVYLTRHKYLCVSDLRWSGDEQHHGINSTFSNCLCKRFDMELFCWSAHNFNGLWGDWSNGIFMQHLSIMDLFIGIFPLSILPSTILCSPVYFGLGLSTLYIF